MIKTTQTQLTEKEMKEQAPSIFTTQPSYKVSNKYSFIPTTRILKDLDKLGWAPYEVSQRKSRTTKDAMFTKHLIRFRNKSITQLGDSIPEIILTNSHDGRNSFNLHAGVFRLVCSNGLIIADKTFSQVKIKHQWYNIDELSKVTNSMVDKLPIIINNIKAMDSKELSEKEKITFTKKAMLTRWPKGNDMLDVEDMLQSIRVGDKGNSVWKIYNVIQEKLIKGGLVFNNKKEKIQKLRPIINIDRKIDVNKNLWELAESYV
tara:strand:+ start:716 stop:1498 length:783 start_codon:yes stop_codon:yes gene_type:complete